MRDYFLAGRYVQALISIDSELFAEITCRSTPVLTKKPFDHLLVVLMSPQPLNIRFTHFCALNVDLRF